MSDRLKVSVDNGKYTVIMAQNGSMKCLRYGEEWRDLTGDGMVLALAQEIEALRKAGNNLRDAQKAYMENRGNQELGKKVGEMAAKLDEVLGTK
jgi:hypothetical protein